MTKLKLCQWKIVIPIIAVSCLGFLYADDKSLGSDTHLEVADLFKDLSIVKAVDHEIKEHLSYIYNYSLIIGYFNMPSARMADTGTTALGFSYVPPYDIISLNFQMFDHLELVGDYRIFQGMLEGGFGSKGYGNDSDRGANAKLALYKQGTGLDFLPSFAIGFEDFYGSRRFYSFYVCATQELLDLNLELTLGWGKGRIKGFFGGLAWTPFRTSEIPVFKDLSLVAEYDAINYKHYRHEHPGGREVKFPINVGISFNLFDFLQFKVSSLRGQNIAAAASIYYNLGQSKGFYPKVQNPPIYTSPVNIEPLGDRRLDEEFAQELAYAFSKQGLNLYLAYLEDDKTHLWLKVINTRYREESQVRERIEHLLSTTTPLNVETVIVVTEADGVATQAYFFTQENLEKYRKDLIGDAEMSTLSPIMESSHVPKGPDAKLIYKRKKDIWTFTIRPRVITFFGSTTGKLKYTAGLIAGPEGYLFDQIYYKTQVAYNIYSSLANVGIRDVYNTSKLLVVRSDTIKYFQSNSVSLEQAYIQKGYNLGNGWFIRAATGYFEPAYGGVALESLYYPVKSNWAFGLEAACALKRKYHGLNFTTKTIKYNDQNIPQKVHFIGYQYFLDVYYDYKPMKIDFKMLLGQFLARDKGVRFELGRYYPSGMRFSIWYTITNAHDEVNYKRYDDKGIAFYIPLDLFLKKSSRSMLGYAMSAWLRDSGAKAATGKPLYGTIQGERINLSSAY